MTGAEAVFMVLSIVVGAIVVAQILDWGGYWRDRK
jgi:cytochrome c biogenesis factor